MFWAWAGPASQSLTFIDRALDRPGPPSPHFYRQRLGQPGPPIPHFYRQESLTFIDKAGQPGSQPLTSIGQTPHFY